MRTKSYKEIKKLIDSTMKQTERLGRKLDRLNKEHKETQQMLKFMDLVNEHGDELLDAVDNLSR